MLLGASVTFVVLLLAFGIYGIIMTLRYSLAVPACTVENLNARAAIKRSISLSKGSRGPDLHARSAHDHHPDRA